MVFVITQCRYTATTTTTQYSSTRFKARPLQTGRNSELHQFRHTALFSQDGIRSNSQQFWGVHLSSQVCITFLSTLVMLCYVMLLYNYLYIASHMRLFRGALKLVGRVWRIGRVDALRPKGHGYDFRSSRHVGTLGKSLTHSCLWRFGVKFRHSIQAVSGGL